MFKIHGDETFDAYLNRAQEYSDALVAIGEPVKDKDLVMLAVSGLRKEYNGLKTTITTCQSPTVFSELHALLSDHDYMFGKILSPIAPFGPQAFYGVRLLNNNMNNNNNNRGNSNNSPKWRQAMKVEYDALIKNGMWSLVPRASNTNVVDGKWVYMLKQDKNGAITCYKARFIGKGFRQQPGNNKGTIDNIICQLGSAFALNDLGPLNYFLGIEIARHNHWSVVKQILRYLHGTVEYGMLIRHSFGSILQASADVLWNGNLDTSLKSFSDADWARDSDY
uniref:Nucleotide-binding, alpha-beta plait n=1 Tax=Tanacetum cinerariifolium TaxID=118510 RepID=A0A699HCM4_TANCI|nr:nucleotide-binding, alpha-beta plait [Tanacetum cinerariifolium]